ncbi:MAG TPA: twin transmembrane helix small protein [Hyphomicrobiaceae bacterium]|nr:twin transmembrane helix small protein [Hyphomicrobiaceae bacterium]
MAAVSSIAVAVVFAVLVGGLIVMARGKSANASQLFMRWRVGLQFLAIVLIILTAYLMRRTT